MECEAKITNISHELFNDGLYFREEAGSKDIFNNEFLRWRYKRMSVICFCASAEAWMCRLISISLNNKKEISNIPLTNQQETLLEFVNGQSKKVPHYKNYYYGTVKDRLYNIIPDILFHVPIDWNNHPYFKDYIELSTIRNSIVHYTKNNDVYNNKIDEVVNKAPDTVENIFKKYKELSEYYKINEIIQNACVPSWFSERQSKIIT